VPMSAAARRIVNVLSTKRDVSTLMLSSIYDIEDLGRIAHVGGLICWLSKQRARSFTSVGSLIGVVQKMPRLLTGEPRYHWHRRFTLLYTKLVIEDLDHDASRNEMRSLLSLNDAVRYSVSQILSISRSLRVRHLCYLAAAVWTTPPDEVPSDEPTAQQQQKVQITIDEAAKMLRSK